MNPDDIEKIELDYLKLEDYLALKEAMEKSYPSMTNPSWSKDQIKVLLDKFPEGQAVIKIDDELAGCCLSIIVSSEDVENDLTYRQITGNYTFSKHNKNGTFLYGIEIFIKPEYRGLRLGRRLYDFRKETCEKLNLKGIVFGGRIPNYHKYSEEISPKEYIEKVKQKEIEDPVLNFQISNDFRPIKIIKNYLEGDTASNEFAVLLRWDNIYYEKALKKASVKKKTVRLGLVQWQMRPYADVDSLMQQAEYFIDTVSGYRSDFAMFPEFLTLR